MLLVCRSYLSDPALIPTVEIVLSKKTKKKKKINIFSCVVLWVSTKFQMKNVSCFVLIVANRYTSLFSAGNKELTS